LRTRREPYCDLLSDTRDIPTTGLNRQSLSFSLSSSPCGPLLSSLLRSFARSLAVATLATAFYFRARSTRRDATRRDAMRRGARRDGRSPRSWESDFISLSTLRSPNRKLTFLLRLFPSLSSRSLAPSPPATIHPSWPITRRNPLPCRPVLYYRARVVVRTRSLSALPSCAAHTAPIPGNPLAMSTVEVGEGSCFNLLFDSTRAPCERRWMIFAMPSMRRLQQFSRNASWDSQNSSRKSFPWLISSNLSKFVFWFSVGQLSRYTCPPILFLFISCFLFEWLLFFIWFENYLRILSLTIKIKKCIPGILMLRFNNLLNELRFNSLPWNDIFY